MARRCQAPRWAALLLLAAVLGVAMAADGDITVSGMPDLSALSGDLNMLKQADGSTQLWFKIEAATDFISAADIFNVEVKCGVSDCSGVTDAFMSFDIFAMKTASLCTFSTNMYNCTIPDELSTCLPPPSVAPSLKLQLMNRTDTASPALKGAASATFMSVPKDMKGNQVNFTADFALDPTQRQLDVKTTQAVQMKVELKSGASAADSYGSFAWQCALRKFWADVNETSNRVGQMLVVNSPFATAFSAASDGQVTVNSGPGPTGDPVDIVTLGGSVDLSAANPPLAPTTTDFYFARFGVAMGSIDYTSITTTYPYLPQGRLPIDFAIAVSDKPINFIDKTALLNAPCPDVSSLTVTTTLTAGSLAATANVFQVADPFQTIRCSFSGLPSMISKTQFPGGIYAVLAEASYLEKFKNPPPNSPPRSIFADFTDTGKLMATDLTSDPTYGSQGYVEFSFPCAPLKSVGAQGLQPAMYQCAIVVGNTVRTQTPFTPAFVDQSALPGDGYQAGTYASGVNVDSCPDKIVGTPSADKASYDASAYSINSQTIAVDNDLGVSRLTCTISAPDNRCPNLALGVVRTQDSAQFLLIGASAESGSFADDFGTPREYPSGRRVGALVDYIPLVAGDNAQSPERSVPNGPLAQQAFPFQLSDPAVYSCILLSRDTTNSPAMMSDGIFVFDTTAQLTGAPPPETGTPAPDTDSADFANEFGDLPTGLDDQQPADPSDLGTAKNAGIDIEDVKPLFVSIEAQDKADFDGKIANFIPGVASSPASITIVYKNFTSKKIKLKVNPAPSMAAMIDTSTITWSIDPSGPISYSLPFDANAGFPSMVTIDLSTGCFQKDDFGVSTQVPCPTSDFQAATHTITFRAVASQEVAGTAFLYIVDDFVANLKVDCNQFNMDNEDTDSAMRPCATTNDCAACKFDTMLAGPLPPSPLGTAYGRWGFCLPKDKQNATKNCAPGTLPGDYEKLITDAGLPLPTYKLFDLDPTINTALDPPVRCPGNNKAIDANTKKTCLKTFGCGVCQKFGQDFCLPGSPDGSLDHSCTMDPDGGNLWTPALPPAPRYMIRQKPAACGVSECKGTSKPTRIYTGPKAGMVCIEYSEAILDAKVCNTAGADKVPQGQVVPDDKTINNLPGEAEDLIGDALDAQPDDEVRNQNVAAASEAQAMVTEPEDLIELVEYFREDGDTETASALLDSQETAAANAAPTTDETTAAGRRRLLGVVTPLRQKIAATPKRVFKPVNQLPKEKKLNQTKKVAEFKTKVANKLQNLTKTDPKKAAVASIARNPGALQKIAAAKPFVSPFQKPGPGKPPVPPATALRQTGSPLPTMMEMGCHACSIITSRITRKLNGTGLNRKGPVNNNLLCDLNSPWSQKDLKNISNVSRGFYVPPAGRPLQNATTNAFQKMFTYWGLAAKTASTDPKLAACNDVMKAHDPANLATCKPFLGFADDKLKSWWRGICPDFVATAVKRLDQLNGNKPATVLNLDLLPDRMELLQFGCTSQLASPADLQKGGVKKCNFPQSILETVDADNLQSFRASGKVPSTKPRVAKITFKFNGKAACDQWLKQQSSVISSALATAVGKNSTAPISSNQFVVGNRTCEQQTVTVRRHLAGATTVTVYVGTVPLTITFNTATYGGAAPDDVAALLATAMKSGVTIANATVFETAVTARTVRAISALASTVNVTVSADVSAALALNCTADNKTCLAQQLNGISGACATSAATCGQLQTTYLKGACGGDSRGCGLALGSVCGSKIPAVKALCSSLKLLAVQTRKTAILLNIGNLFPGISDAQRASLRVEFDEQIGMLVVFVRNFKYKVTSAKSRVYFPHASLKECRARRNGGWKAGRANFLKAFIAIFNGLRPDPVYPTTINARPAYYCDKKTNRGYFDFEVTDDMSSGDLSSISDYQKAQNIINDIIALIAAGKITVPGYGTAVGTEPAVVEANVTRALVRAKDLDYASSIVFVPLKSVVTTLILAYSGGCDNFTGDFLINDDDVAANGTVVQYSIAGQLFKILNDSGLAGPVDRQSFVVGNVTCNTAGQLLVPVTMGNVNPATAPADFIPEAQDTDASVAAATPTPTPAGPTPSPTPRPANGTRRALLDARVRGRNLLATCTPGTDTYGACLASALPVALAGAGGLFGATLSTTSYQMPNLQSAASAASPAFAALVASFLAMLALAFRPRL